MKKVFLIMLAVLLGFTTANAQFEKGGKTLSGRLSGLDLSFGKSNGENFLNANLSLAGSYFVADKIAVEGLLGVQTEKYGDLDAATAFTFGIGARYYLYEGLFAGVAYQGVKLQDVDLLSYLDAQIGYDYYITENVFIEPAFHFVKGISSLDKSSTFGLSLGIGVNF